MPKKSTKTFTNRTIPLCLTALAKCFRLVPIFAIGVSSYISFIDSVIANDRTQRGGYDPVFLGAPHSLMDAPIFIAEKKGYFAEERIQLNPKKFSTLSEMTALLVSGQLDVGVGSVSAGIVNAAAQGIPIKVVAGKGSTPPGYGYPFVLASGLDIESFRSASGLKGARIGTSTPGGTIEVIWARYLQMRGLGWNDVQRVTLGMPDQVVLFSNGGINASLMLEPFASRVVANGHGRIVQYSDEILPNLQAGVVAYGGPFMSKRREVGIAFMRAYLRASADFVKAISETGWTGPNADEVIAIVAEFTSVPPEVVRRIKPQYLHADGSLDVDSIDTSIDLWRWIGRVTNKDVRAADIVDLTFLEQARRSK